MPGNPRPARLVRHAEPRRPAGKADQPAGTPVRRRLPDRVHRESARVTVPSPREDEGRPAGNPPGRHKPALPLPDPAPGPGSPAEIHLHGHHGSHSDPAGNTGGCGMPGDGSERGPGQRLAPGLWNRILEHTRTFSLDEDLEERIRVAIDEEAQKILQELPVTQHERLVKAAMQVEAHSKWLQEKREKPAGVAEQAPPGSQPGSHPEGITIPQPHFACANPGHRGQKPGDRFHPPPALFQFGWKDEPGHDPPQSLFKSTGGEPPRQVPEWPPGFYCRRVPPGRAQGQPGRQTQPQRRD